MIFRLILKKLKLCNIVFVVCFSILALLSLFSVDSHTLFLGFEFGVLYFVGVIGSFTIHEYAHLKLLHYFQVPVEIKFSVLSISIIPLKRFDWRNEMVVAVAGPLVSSCIGILMLFINIWLGLYIINILACFYLLHIIFLLPFFGDGKVLFKALYKFIRGNVK